MLNITVDELNEMLATCATEALNDWLDDASTEEIAMMLCVANTWRKAQRAKSALA